MDPNRPPVPKAPATPPVPGSQPEQQAPPAAPVRTPPPADSSAVAGSLPSDVPAAGDSLSVQDSLSFADTLAVADSLAAADSSALEEPDTTKIGFAVALKNVKIFKKNMQIVCDSLLYSDLDSLARLFKGRFEFHPFEAHPPLARLLCRNEFLERQELRTQIEVVDESILFVTDIDESRIQSGHDLADLAQIDISHRESGLALLLAELHQHLVLGQSDRDFSRGYIDD